MILLDSHVILWLAVAPDRLSSAATRAIEEAGASGVRPFVSVASLYEIAYAVHRGRIRPAIPESEFLTRLGSPFEIIPIQPETALFAAQIPDPFHGDPMDRLIAATAILGGLTLVTSDRKIRTSGTCRTLW